MKFEKYEKSKLFNKKEQKTCIRKIKINVIEVNICAIPSRMLIFLMQNRIHGTCVVADSQRRGLLTVVWQDAAYFSRSVENNETFKEKIQSIHSTRKPKDYNC